MTDLAGQQQQDTPQAAAAGFSSVAAAFKAGALPQFFAQPALMGPRAERFEHLSRLMPSSQPDRQALAEALEAYHAHLGLLRPATLEALATLRQPQSRVVVTGQQAGLLTGPAYAVHKGADAALLARALHTPEAPVVGVYWVASQDHDAAEVSWAALLDMEEHLWREVVDLPAGVPVGRVLWRDEWTEKLRGLFQQFQAPETHKAAAWQRVAAAVAPLADGNPPSWADVFSRLIHGLLGSEGLLMLDPMFPPLARLMQPTLEAELRQPLAGPQRIEQAAAALAELGLSPQLRRPEGATNLFLEGADGQRRLLRVSGDGSTAGHSAAATFSTDDGASYALAELLDLLEADPSRITPAAGLRPTVQDALLPNIALILGNGEIGYLAQLLGVYDLHGVRQPQVWPRLSVTWLEPNVARILRRFGAKAAEVQADPAGTLGRALAQARGISAVSGQRLTSLQADWEALSSELAALDPTLERPSERARESAARHFAALQRRAVEALARQEDVRSGQLSRLEAHLLPAGTEQERQLSFFTYLLKHGSTPLGQLLELPAGAQAEVEIP